MSRAVPLSRPLFAALLALPLAAHGADASKPEFTAQTRERLDQQQAPAVADAVERCLEGQRSTVGRSVGGALCRHRIHRW